MKVVAKESASNICGWLDERECVPVLALSIALHEGAKFLLWSSKQQAVALFLQADFDVVDGSLSPRWTLKLGRDGFVQMAPQAWQADGFWERYYDCDASAEQIFEHEMALILSEG
jgi:hypothetical protein